MVVIPRRAATMFVGTVVVVLLLFGFKTPDQSIGRTTGGSAGVVADGGTTSGTTGTSGGTGTSARGSTGTSGGSGSSGSGTTPAATAAPRRGIRKRHRLRPDRLHALRPGPGPDHGQRREGHGDHRPPAAVRRPVRPDLPGGRADPPRRGAVRAERADRHRLRGDLHERRVRAEPPGGPRPGRDLTHVPRRVEEVMGTAVSLDLRDPDIPADAVDAVFGHLHDIDARFSTYRPDSEVSRLARGELDPDAASPDVRHVLAVCEQLRRDSGGAFDAGRAGRDGRPRSLGLRQGLGGRGGRLAARRRRRARLPHQRRRRRRGARRGDPRPPLARRHPPPGRAGQGGRGPGRPRRRRGDLRHVRARRPHRRPADRRAGAAACAA